MFFYQMKFEVGGPTLLPQPPPAHQGPVVVLAVPHLQYTLLQQYRLLLANADPVGNL